MEFSMMKRTVARLLLFGIPFTMAYYGARPTPVTDVPTLVICSFSESSDTGRTIVVAETPAACSFRETSQNETSPDGIRPAARMSSGDAIGDVYREPLHLSF
jgi:hypothetical protein